MLAVIQLGDPGYQKLKRWAMKTAELLWVLFGYLKASSTMAMQLSMLNGQLGYVLLDVGSVREVWERWQVLHDCPSGTLLLGQVRRLERL